MRNPRVGGNELKYLTELIDSGFPGKIEGGSFTGRLETAFAQKFNSRYAVTFANGTATLHAALHALGVGPGDEVIVPPLTMSSTSLAVLHAGATPVWADVDPDTFVLDPRAAAEKITPRTKAIMPVSLYGLPAPVPELRKLGLPIVEDSAQCFLGTIDGKYAGTLGDIGSFSFQNSKHMTCGEGGICVTDDEKLALAMRRFGSLGYGQIGSAPGASKISKSEIVSPEAIRHVSLGFNFRLSDICSAVLLAQLERLEELTALRRKCADAFREVLKDCSWMKPQVAPAGVVNSYWATAVQLDTDRVPWHEFYDEFVRQGGDGFYGAWRLTYQEPFFAEHFHGISCPVAERLQKRMVQFKTHYQTDAEIDREVSALERTIAHFADR